ncbi:MAG: transporter substrate-binding domain-containing protein [Candidatus Poribacteria bacterium]|nr:transporter substrate-binding domain-containing protein [Candidatus Poribacteria bacterium]
MRVLFIIVIVLFVFSMGCENLVNEIMDAPDPSCPPIWNKGPRVLNVGFYAYFAPISYGADPDPTSDGFNTHLGYEADILTALESIADTGLSFSRKAIGEWPGIWLKAAEPEYDIIGGGITILDSRRQDATGTPLVAFTAGHIKFRQSLLVRLEDAQRLSYYTDLTHDVRVGVLAGTTGEARLLEITGFIDANGILALGTRIETLHGTFVADGTAAYRITAADVSPNLLGRTHLYPPAEKMPQVIYLGSEVGESELLEALADGRIDAIARGEIGNRDATAASDGEFVVTALDEQVEYGGFTVALTDAELLAYLNWWIDYLTDSGNIGYAEWSQDHNVFMARAQMWPDEE